MSDSNPRNDEHAAGRHEPSAYLLPIVLAIIGAVPAGLLSAPDGNYTRSGGVIVLAVIVLFGIPGSAAGFVIGNVLSSDRPSSIFRQFVVVAGAQFAGFVACLMLLDWQGTTIRRLLGDRSFREFDYLFLLSGVLLSGLIGLAIARHSIPRPDDASAVE